MYKHVTIKDNIHYYDGKAVVHDGGCDAIVIFNGKVLGGCVEADSEKGLVRAYKFFKEGGRTWVSDTGEFMLLEGQGDVRILSMGEFDAEFPSGLDWTHL